MDNFFDKVYNATLGLILVLSGFLGISQQAPTGDDISFGADLRVFTIPQGGTGTSTRPDPGEFLSGDGSGNYIVGNLLTSSTTVTLGLNNALQFSETTTPEATPPAGTGFVYLKDEAINGGELFLKTDDGLELSLVSGSGGGGSIDGAVNVGAGEGVFKQVSGSDLEFKSLVAGSNITITDNGDDLTIESSAGGAQTPWTDNVDGAGFNLTNAGDITARSFTATNTAATSTLTNLLVSGFTSFGNKILSTIDAIGDAFFGGIVQFTNNYPVGPGTTPTSSEQLVDKAYVDNLVNGLSFKDSAIVATTADITLSGLQTIDGYLTIANDRVLVKNQSDQTENGCYVAAAGAWSRCADYDETAEVFSGTAFLVIEGTTQAATQWVMNATGSITIGSSDITFAQVSAPQNQTASLGVQKVGNDFRADLDPIGGIELNGDSLRIGNATVTDAMLAGDISWNKVSKTGSLLNDLGNVDDSGKQDWDILSWDNSNSTWIAVATPTSTVIGSNTVVWQIVATPQTNQAWTNQPAAETELFGTTLHRGRLDLTNAYRYRIVVNQGVAGFAGADINLQCSSDNSTYIDADSGAAAERDIGTGTGLKIGNWATLVTACRGDRYLRIVGKDGNATADPAFRGLRVEFGMVPAITGTTATSTLAVPIIATPQTAQAWTNMPLATTELFSTTLHRQKLDLRRATKYRLVATLSVASAAGADLNLQYSTDNSSFSAADTAAAGELDISSGTGNIVTGAWADLVTGAKGDVWLRIVGKDGNGVADPAFRSLVIQFEIETDAEPQYSFLNPWDYQSGVGALTPTSSSAGIFVNASSTFNSTLRVNGNVTSTNAIHSTEFCLSNDCISSWASGGGGAAWEAASGFTNTLTPTSSGAGFYVTGSSTVQNNFRVDGNATTTGKLVVGSYVNPTLNNYAIHASATDHGVIGTADAGMAWTNVHGILGGGNLSGGDVEAGVAGYNSDDGFAGYLSYYNDPSSYTAGVYGASSNPNVYGGLGFSDGGSLYGGYFAGGTYTIGSATTTVRHYAQEIAVDDAVASTTIGIYSINNETTGNAGYFGTTGSGQNVVSLIADSGTGSGNIGILGRASASGQYGVSGHYSHSEGYTGRAAIYGTIDETDSSQDTSGALGYLVSGSAFHTAGVWGSDNAGNGRWAGYFAGDAAVIGGLIIGDTASTGDFNGTNGLLQVCTGSCTGGNFATAAGEAYIEGDLEADGNFNVAGNASTTGSFNVDSTTLHVDASANNVGIGTIALNADYKLTVTHTNSSANNNDFRGANIAVTNNVNDSLSGSLANYGMTVSYTDTGTYNGTSSGNTESSYGIHVSTSNTGATSGGSPHFRNVYGGYASATNTGAASGTDIRSTYGFYGAATSDTNSSADAAGIYGTATGADTNYGVRGVASSNSTINYGLHASAAGTSATNYGVYGTATGGTTNWAGYFPSGNVYIGGQTGLGITPATGVKLDVDTGSNTLGIRIRGTAETAEIGDIYMQSSGQMTFDNRNGTDTSPYFIFYSETSGNALGNILQINNENSAAVGGTNLGAGIAYNLEDSSGFLDTAAFIKVQWADATNGSEDSLMYFEHKIAGSVTRALEIDQLGYVAIGNAGTVQAADGNGDLYIEGELEVDGLPSTSGGDNVLCYNVSTGTVTYDVGAGDCSGAASPFLMSIDGQYPIAEVLANQWKIEANSVNRIYGYEGADKAEFILASLKEDETDWMDSITMNLRCEQDHITTVKSYNLISVDIIEPSTNIGKPNTEEQRIAWLNAAKTRDGQYLTTYQGDFIYLKFEQPQPEDYKDCDRPLFTFDTYGYYDYEHVEFDNERIQNFWEQYQDAKKRLAEIIETYFTPVFDFITLKALRNY